MVSALWKACSDGDLEQVRALLAEAAPTDVELKDHTGATPLIEAVRNGHVEVVRALLEKGADPQNASSQGRPDQYTSDPAILELLNVQANFAAPNYPQNHHMNEFAHHPPPPGAYPFYAPMGPGMPGMGDGVFYPPTSPHGENGAVPPGMHPGLPPPELARMIPCRYWPACRFGPRCMFLHPAPPYYPGPNMPPPGQYPMFDPAMGHPPYGYYPPPPPPHFQPNGAPMAPLSPHGHHTSSPSDGSHYPAGGPVPPAQFVSVSPGAYPPPPPPGPMAGPPMQAMHQQPPPPAGPQSPSAVYHPAHPIQSYPGPEPAGQYMPPPPAATNGFPEQDAVKANGQQDPAFPPQSGHHREGSVNRRGGSVAGRRSSFATKKPACLFFPAGKCKNGDDCRFPHVVDNNPVPNHIPPFYMPRGPPRPRNNHHGAPSVINLEQKMANMAVQDAPRPQANGVSDQQNQVAPQSQPLKNDFGNRPRYQGPKHHQHFANGPHGARKPGPANPRAQQRVPGADDFPVLPGSSTPPRVNGVNGHGTSGGPTAADILRAPAPVRSKDGASEDGAATSTRGPSPSTSRTRTPEVKEPVKAAPAPVAAEQPVHAQVPAPITAPQKLPVSFAAAAAASSVNAAESAPRVAVSA